MDLLKILDGTPEPPIIEIHLQQHNASGDYYLPTPMLDFQKELTDQIISLHYSDILKYFETGTRTDLLINSLQTCYLNTQLVSSHPYLLINHYMPKSLISKDIPLKLAETSGKFQTLRNLINIFIQFGKKNLAIVLKNDRVIDLVEAMLLGSKCNIKRFTGNYVRDPSKSKKHDLNVFLFPSDAKLSQKIDPTIKFDLLISFDISVDINLAFTQQILHQNRKQKAAIIRLVPVNTIEHCALFFRKKYEQGSDEYLNAVTAAIVCLRERVGVLQPDLRPIYNQNLTYLTLYFNRLFTIGEDLPVEWPLPDMSAILEYSPIDVERSLLTEVHYYTPDDDDEAPKSPKKPTYYNLKRLNKDYITNPLKNSDSNLTGISSITEESFYTILTHKLMARLNMIYIEWERVNQELVSYHTFEPSRSRTLHEVRLSLTKITDDINHLNKRITAATKRANKKSEDIVKIKEEIEVIENSLASLTLEFKGNEKLSKWYDNQMRIFDLQEKIETQVKKLQSRKTEIEYTSKEVDTAKKSMKESALKVEEVTNENKQLNSKLEVLFDDINVAGFLSERTRIKAEIKKITLKNSELASKMNDHFKVLHDVSHKNRYGSRKGRGNSPNIK